MKRLALAVALLLVAVSAHAQMPATNFVIVDHSTNPLPLADIVDAVNEGLDQFAAVWGQQGRLYLDDAPADATRVLLLDRPIGEGWLGYHYRRSIRICAKASCLSPDLGATQIIAHEIEEMLIDPHDTNIINAPCGPILEETNDPVVIWSYPASCRRANNAASNRQLRSRSRSGFAGAQFERHE
jgi:hypothetical protein